MPKNKSGGAKQMARYTGAVCRLCRRENQKLFLKGTRCFSEKCALSKRAYAPGQHGQARKKMSEYSHTYCCGDCMQTPMKPMPHISRPKSRTTG